MSYYPSERLHELMSKDTLTEEEEEEVSLRLEMETPSKNEPTSIIGFGLGFITGCFFGN